MSTDDKLQVKVDWHPGGRFTLKEGIKGNYSDCQVAGLFGNYDKAGFYRAVAKRLAQHASNGTAFVYSDCNYDQ